MRSPFISYYHLRQMLAKLRFLKYLFANWQTVQTSLRASDDPIALHFRSGQDVSISRSLLQYLLSSLYDGDTDISKVKFEDGKIWIGDMGFRPLDSNPYLELLLASGWRLEEDFIVKDNVRFFLNGAYSIIYETFERAVHWKVVEGREVVDVGASIGDTAVFFALNGASRVLAFEPLPSVYAIARRNILANHLQDKVKLYNCGVSTAVKEYSVPLQIDIDASGTFSPHPSGGGYKIEAISLSQLLSLSADPYLLKLDCEGCEYSVVLGDYSSVRDFEVVELEYHALTVGRSVNSIINIMKKDYKVILNSNAQGSDIHLNGLLYCIKRTS